MTKQALYIIRGVLLLLAVLALWWSGSKIIDIIRGPVVAELEVAVKANKSLEQDRNAERAAKEWLNQVLLDRDKREKGVDDKRDQERRDVERKRKADKALDDLFSTRLPDSLFGVPDAAERGNGGSAKGLPDSGGLAKPR